MKLVMLLSLLAISVFCRAEDKPFYVGTWQSNEAKTLASMEKVEGMPEKSKETFRQNFFGKLVNVIKKDSFTTFFTNQKPDEPEFIDADIQVLSPNKVRIKYFHESRGKHVVRELLIEDNCYTLPVLQWDFEEYFCRVDGPKNVDSNSAKTSQDDKNSSAP